MFSYNSNKHYENKLKTTSVTFHHTERSHASCLLPLCEFKSNSWIKSLHQKPQSWSGAPIPIPQKNTRFYHYVKSGKTIYGSSSPKIPYSSTNHNWEDIHDWLEKGNVGIVIQSHAVLPQESIHKKESIELNGEYSQLHISLEKEMVRTPLTLWLFGVGWVNWAWKFSNVLVSFNITLHLKD